MPRVPRKIVKRREGLERPFCNGQWTRARFFQFIRTALRSASVRWAPIQLCLKLAETGRRINPKSGRLAMHYRCARCDHSYPRKGVVVDHIIPVGSLKSFDDLPGFAERMFCEVDSLRVLCLGCDIRPPEKEVGLFRARGGRENS